MTDLSGSGLQPGDSMTETCATCRFWGVWAPGDSVHLCLAIRDLEIADDGAPARITNNGKLFPAPHGVCCGAPATNTPDSPNMNDYCGVCTTYRCDVAFDVHPVPSAPGEETSRP